MEKKPSIQTEKVFIGADHAGYAAKESIKKYLDGLRIPYEDLGSHDPKSSDDYPDFAKAVCKKVAGSKGKAKGILVCGSGTGMSMAANRIRGIRAALGYDMQNAKMSRLHNDANVLALGGRRSTHTSLKRIVGIWLKTPFSGESRHERRIRKLEALH